MKRRREKVYGQWMSHFEVRYILRRASKAAAAGLGMTYKEWREGVKREKIQADAVEAWNRAGEYATRNSVASLPLFEKGGDR